MLSLTVEPAPVVANQLVAASSLAGKPAGHDIARLTRRGLRLLTSTMQPRIKVWIETEDGHVALSEWRVMLLQAVAEHGSLVAAARALGVPHRTAWQRIQEMETCLGVRLLETTSGGIGGGRSQLSPAAIQFIERYQSLRSGLDDLVHQRFASNFEAAAPPGR